MRVIVLGGGTSPERDVSIRSAKSVSEALREAGYEVITIDPKDGWEQLDSIASDDIVFPILHGAEGEDGTVQSLLESKNLKYLGSDSISSRLCFDKGLTLKALKAADIAVADGQSDITYDMYKTHRLNRVPHVIKVQRGGSSIGTYLVRDPSIADQNKIREVFSLDSVAVIEELVEGIEITVPILGNVALPVIEIIPPENAEFDYENKYNGKSQELCPAKSIDEALQKKAQQVALKVHKVLGCRHLSRIDIIVRKNSEIIVLEANTIPGMTNQSLYPLSAKVYGLSMSQLMVTFMNMIQHKNEEI